MIQMRLHHYCEWGNPPATVLEYSSVVERVIGMTESGSSQFLPFQHQDPP